MLPVDSVGVPEALAVVRDHHALHPRLSVLIRVGIVSSLAAHIVMKGVAEARLLDVPCTWVDVNNLGRGLGGCVRLAVPSAEASY